MTDSDWTSVEDLVSSSGRPGPDQMLLVARWVTAALDEGHRRGAVHGRLGPRTIGLELGTDGAPVRATIRPPDEGGDPAWDYAAPEVVRGADPDAAADVYSCGAVLWHCLTGQVPHPGSPPRVLAPEPLEGALRAMLTEAPGARPSAARAGELLTASPPAGPAAPAESRSRSRGWIAALSATVLLLGVSVLGWVVWQVVQDDPARTSAASSTRPPAGTPPVDESAEDDTALPDAAPPTEPGTGPSTEDEPATQRPTQRDRTEEDAAQDDQPRQITLPPAAELCEDRLDEPYPQVWAGNEVTSCPFSVNVREAYLAQGESGDDVEVVADSPVTGRAYTMTCEDTSPVRCRGGNSAIVYLGDD